MTRARPSHRSGDQQRAAGPADGALDEDAAVELLGSIFRAPAGSSVVLGVGDDAALLTARGRLVWTVDASLEGSHFERAWMPLYSIGYRAFQAAASDLAAMGARPIGALSSLELPPGFSRKELHELATGQAAAARATACPVAGGNLASAPRLAIHTTLLGRASQPVTRAGARPGDELWLAGDVGLAHLGLRLMLDGKRRRGSAVARCLRALREPRARLDDGEALANRARAMMDLSDGLARDAPRLAHASGVRLILEGAALLQGFDATLRSLARRLGIDPLDAMIAGGEDYALLATGRASRRPAAARRIGRVEAGAGVYLEAPDGSCEVVDSRRGWDHLR